MKSKKIISFRRQCKGATGTGLSHYIMLAPKK
jgi:modified peptide precursor CbpA